MLRLLLVVSLTSVSSGCVTIKNANICSTAGKLSAGSICSRLTTSDTNDLTFKETLDLLEAQSDRTCVAVQGFSVCSDNQNEGVPIKLPSRGAAIIMSSEDFKTLITELEMACRELGDRCTYSTAQIINNYSH